MPNQNQFRSYAFGGRIFVRSIVGSQLLAGLLTVKRLYWFKEKMAQPKLEVNRFTFQIWWCSGISAWCEKPPTDISLQLLLTIINHCGNHNWIALKFVIFYCLERCQYFFKHIMDNYDLCWYFSLFCGFFSSFILGTTEKSNGPWLSCVAGDITLHISAWYGHAVAGDARLGPPVLVAPPRFSLHHGHPWKCATALLNIPRISWSVTVCSRK